MHIRLSSDDYHYGRSAGNQGSSVATARRGGDLAAQLRLFWNWVQANKLEDDVMVVVTHEFSRSAYNKYMGKAEVPVMVNGEEVKILVPGVDHWFLMGMIFINGKVAPASRIGVIGDTYVAKATKDFAGTITDGKAYTSDQLMGNHATALLWRCF